jgi:hypothetical protein
MRSAERDVRAIARCDAEAFGGQVAVRLFGSRAEDDLRGGNIDLQLEIADCPDQGGPVVRRPPIFNPSSEPS